MNKKIIIAVVLLLAGGVGWLFHYFSDQQVIRRKFAAMAVHLAKSGEETPVMIALKMKPVKDFIAPACEVTVPERNYHEVLDPGLVTHYLILYRSRQANLKLLLEEVKVEVVGKGRAEVGILVRVSANYNQAGFFEEAYRVSFSLQKQEKSWLLTRAVIPNALVNR